VGLTCSDSRVPPELLFDQALGDLFVVRSAGNIVDAVGRGGIEYAIEHLGASVLVVLGHEKCGAATAACSGEKVPSPKLEAILDQISPRGIEGQKLRAIRYAGRIVYSGKRTSERNRHPCSQ